MPRVKRGIIHLKKRRALLKRTKGFKWGRKKQMRVASTAATKAGVHAYRGRKHKKIANRRLWQIQLNAASRLHELSYSQLINRLKTNQIEINRKVLSEIAQTRPEIFTKILAGLKK